jgi:peptidoglycan/xylan/chitin deacetylase (PgdA/CDA1 family)
MNALATALLASMAWTAVAKAADCPRKGTLGTSRILSVDAASTPRVGLKNFSQTLPLWDHEVVLTFDDGPWPPTTPKVLAALAQECVQATFFLIGKPASEHPELVRRIAAAGHTIGHHTWMHRSLMRIKPGETTEEIDRGISANEMALHGVASTVPSTPFFRFPGFETTPATLDLLHSRGIVVFGADLWAILECIDAEAGIEADHRPAQGRPKGHYPVSRPQSANRGHAAGIFALSAGQRLPRGPSDADRIRRPL